MTNITKTVLLLSLLSLHTAIAMDHDRREQGLNKRNQAHIVSEYDKTREGSPRIKRECLNDVIELPKSTNSNQQGIFGHLAIHPLYEICSPGNNAEQFANRLVEIHKRDLLPILNPLPSRTVIAGYKTFLRDKLKDREDINPEAMTTLINNIIPTFKDMYSGIVRPYIIIALEEELNIDTGQLYR